MLQGEIDGLIEIGRRYWSGDVSGKNIVMRISGQPSPIQNTIDQK